MYSIRNIPVCFYAQAINLFHFCASLRSSNIMNLTCNFDIHTKGNKQLKKFDIKIVEILKHQEKRVKTTGSGFRTECLKHGMNTYKDMNHLP